MRGATRVNREEAAFPPPGYEVIYTGGRYFPVRLHLSDTTHPGATAFTYADGHTVSFPKRALAIHYIYKKLQAQKLQAEQISEYTEQDSSTSASQTVHETHVSNTIDTVKENEVDRVDKNIEELTMQLREKEQLLAIALEISALGLWQLDLATGQLDCTPMCKANFGLSSDTIFTYDALIQAIHPDDREQMQRAVQRAVQEHADYHAEYRAQWPDSSWHWIRAHGYALYEDDGVPTGMIGLTLDVTERRQMEVHFHQAEQEALEALISLAEGLVQPLSNYAKKTIESGETSTTDTVAQHLVELIRRVLGCQRVSITILNPETHAFCSVAVVGIPPELESQWRARRPGFFLSEQFDDPMMDARLREEGILILDFTQPPLQSRPNPYGIQKMLLAPMLVESSLVGILALDHGKKEYEYKQSDLALAKAVAKLAALVVERDRLLVERAEARANELALREANRLMDEFIGIASHEIRTPLTTIKASVQLAKRQLDKLVKQEPILQHGAVSQIATTKGFLERAERQIGMQNRLVSDLLDVSRIRVSRLELHPELCDLAAIVRETVEDQRYLTPSRVIRLDMTPPGEILVMADRDRVGQVINNYLSNALKYSEMSKSVEVRLELEGTMARVSVRDQGPGLAPAEQQRIWERFYRVEGIPVKSGSGVGLGLGLHISQTIIERQGGHVGVESKLDQGSTFWFMLPLAEPDN